MEDGRPHAATLGEGEVAARWCAKPGRVSAVAPIMVKTPANPDGVPMEVFDMVRRETATNRAQSFYDRPSSATTARARK